MILRVNNTNYVLERETMKKILGLIIVTLSAGCNAPLPKRPSGEKVVINHQPPPPTITATRPAPLWKAEKGSTLRNTTLRWAKNPEAKCKPSSSGHWNILWDTHGVDYPIDADLTFQGSFQQSITKLFELYREAEKPLHVNGYPNQCLIIVSDAP